MPTDPRTEPIVVQEGGRTLAFVYDELMRYHGGAMPGGVALAYRLMQAVFRQHRAAGGALPQRGASAFYSGLGENGQGILDAADCVLRLRRHALLRTAPQGAIPPDAPPAPGGNCYYFELALGNTLYAATLRNGLIPPEFFALSQQRHDASKGLAAFTDADMARLMTLRARLADDVMRADEAALFQITVESVPELHTGT